MERINIYRVNHFKKHIYYCKPFIEYNVNDYSENNINHLNNFYSEFCCTWDIYKNNKYSKYIGFDHYRRVFPFHMSNDIEQWYNLLDNDYYLYFDFKNLKTDMNIYKYLVPNSELKYFDLYLCMDRWNVTELFYDITKKYINDNYPEIFENNQYNPKLYLFIRRNMYICNWKMFLDIAKFVTGWIELINNYYDLNYDYTKHANLVFNHFYNKIKEEHAIPCFPWRIQSFLYSYNTYRIYSFILEFLVSMYIKSKKHLIFYMYKNSKEDNYFF